MANDGITQGRGKKTAETQREAEVRDGQLPGVHMLRLVLLWVPGLSEVQRCTVEDWIVGFESSFPSSTMTYLPLHRASWAGQWTSQSFHSGLGCITHFGQWNVSRCEREQEFEIGLEVSCPSVSAMRMTCLGSSRMMRENPNPTHVLGSSPAEP